MSAVVPRRTLDDLLAEAAARIVRYTPEEALAAVEAGGILIDVRSEASRVRDGIVPASIHVPRTVLEWRLDPDSAAHDPRLGGLDQQVILICDHGCSTVLAAATLAELGFTRVGDVIGGYEEWARCGLPTAPERERAH